LALAIGAAAVLDVLLLVSFGWSELIGQNLRNTAWVVFAAAWAVAVGWSIRERRRQAVLRRVNPQQDAFVEALEHYLKGDYYQTEQLLAGLIGRNARDLEARLMLATLLRHSGRVAEAAGQLDALGRLEGAEKWQFEMEEERQLLAEAETPAASAA
jgi:thioredoxin-like negative regulator of GroEL